MSAGSDEPVSDFYLETLLNILDALETQIHILRSTISLQRRCPSASGTSASGTAEAQTPEVPPLSPQSTTVTPRQQEVIAQLGRGLSNRQIARRLGMSEATVKSHLYAAYRKLGVSSRSEAILEVLKKEKQ